MPDTDYDDLPSPPRARARANTAAGTSGRTYGRKAGRKRARGESAHTGRGGDATGGGASAGAGTVRSGSSDDEDARGPRGKGKGEGKPRGEGGEGARRGRARRVTSRARREREEDEEEQGDVESNDEAVGRGVAPGGSKRSAKARRVTITSRGSTAPPAEDSERVRAPTQPTRSRPVRRAKRASSVEEEPRMRSALVSPQHAGPSRSVSPSDDARMRALGDKSNLTVDSPRASSRRRPSQLAKAPRSSTSRQSLSASPRLSVFRDISPDDVARGIGASTRPTGQPVVSASRPSSRSRVPRAASSLRLSPAPPPHRSAPSPAPARRSLSRSPSPDLPLPATRRHPSTTLHASPRAPQRSSPARLAVPGSSRDSLGGAPSLPAPWALAAPADERSSSPRAAHDASRRGEQGGGLVFRYTTTEFGDLPSLRLSLDGPLGIEAGKGGTGADDGPGMESSIVLETWEDEMSRLGLGGRDEEEAQPGLSGHEEGEVTIRREMGEADGEVEGGEPAAMEVDAPTQDDAGVAEEEEVEDDVVLVALPLGDDAPTMNEDGDETIKAAASPPVAAPSVDPAEDMLLAPEESKDPVAVPEVPEETLAAPHLLSSPKSSSIPSPPPRPAFFSASSMPPRRARPSFDEPLPDGPPSDEDPLGYYLRTAGTFSSEDDLPSSAPSDASQLEDYLAEREVGRAVKPSSHQRDKRVAASAQARLKRLRLDATRREGRERQVLDVGDVKLSRAVRAAIEARAEGVATEEEEREVREAVRAQKARWRTG